MHEEWLFIYSICSGCHFISLPPPPTWGPRGGNISTETHLRMLSTAGHMTALPFFRFIFQGLCYSSPSQRASVSICLLRGEVNISTDKSLCASLPGVPLWHHFHRHLSLQLPDRRIFIVLLSQTHILTVWDADLPSQVLCLRLAYLRMRGWLTGSTNDHSHRWYSQTKAQGQATCKQGSHFSFGKIEKASTSDPESFSNGLE